MIGKFLVYTEESDAWEKAEEEGRSQLPQGWNGDSVTKYITVPQVTDAETYALEVSDYTTLTQSELDAIQTNVLFRWEIDE